MGYSMYQSDASFRVKRENIPAMMQAIRDLAGVEEGEPANKYSWVPKKFYEAEDIEGLFGNWRWDDIDIDKNGDIVHIRFTGEKLGDDATLLEAIAPYVEHMSFIEMVGEDDHRWRWVFVWGELREETPIITWPYLNNLPMQELVRAAGEQT
jgi:hypothetical protein